MKTRNIILYAISFLAVLSLFTVCISASGGELIIDYDYSRVTYGDNTYVLCEDRNGTIYLLESNRISNISLTKDQTSEISSVEAYSSDKIIELFIDFNKGGSAHYIYVREDCVDEYIRFLSRGSDKCRIEVYQNSYDQYIEVDISELKGEKKLMAGYEVKFFSICSAVYSMGFDKTVSGDICGYIYKDSDRNSFFYIDAYQFDKADNADFSPELHKNVTVWEITSSEIISALSNSIYDDTIDTDTDFFGEQSLSASIIIMVAGLGIIPMLGIIICLSIAAKSQKPYKVCLRVASALFLAVIVTLMVSIAVTLTSLS